MVMKLQENKVDNFWKESLVWVSGILGFFGMMVFMCVYCETMREECRLAAIQQNYTAVEIQAICK